jgi:hypothetical protein
MPHASGVSYSYAERGKREYLSIYPGYSSAATTGPTTTTRSGRTVGSSREKDRIVINLSGKCLLLDSTTTIAGVFRIN